MSNKGLVSRMYKEPSQLNRKINNPIRKWANDMKTFLQRGYTDGK